MNTRSRIALGLLGGTIAFVAALILIDSLFWSQCGGKDIYSWPNIFVCWHLSEITAIGSLAGGFVAGLLSGRRGLAVGVVVAISGFALFSWVVRYPFGTDKLFALQWGLLLYFLPAVFACVVGAKLAGGKWRIRSNYLFNRTR
jgi:ribose/xylose/arabinose/galactoside ABC-type transport system permease subunit